MKYIKGFVEEVKNEIVSAVATTDTKDRDNESVNIQGWDLKNFKKNPILLWSHRADELPIGKITNIWQEGSSLKFDAKFADKDKFADRIKNLVQQGILNSFSVGFMSNETDEEGNSTDQELLEISLVNVPANPEARLASAYKSFVKDFKAKVSEEKSPACRKDGETKKECVSRKIPELVKEGMKQDQAVAVANKLCDVKCSDKTPKAELPEEFKNRLRICESALEETQDMVKELLKAAESKKSDKVVSNKPTRAKNLKLEALKRLSKEIEILIIQENKKLN